MNKPENKDTSNSLGFSSAMLDSLSNFGVDILTDNNKVKVPTETVKLIESKVTPKNSKSVDVKDIPVNFVDNSTTDVDVKVIESKTDDSNPVDITGVIPVTRKLPKVDINKVTSTKAINAFDLKQQIGLVGYYNMNYGITIQGQGAIDVLLPLFDKYAFLDCQGGYYRLPLRIKFAEVKEVIEIARKAKVRKSGRVRDKDGKLVDTKPITTTEVDYREQSRVLYVPNPRDVTLGLPSEHQYGVKRGWKGTVLDTSKIIECYLGDTVIYIADKKTPSTRNIKVLGSQAINQNSGKDRYNKDGGYSGVRRVHTKRNTGTKLTTDMKVWIDTRIRSKPFVIAGLDNTYQVKVLPTGNIMLMQHISGNFYNVGVIAKLTDYYLIEEKELKQDVESTVCKYYFAWSYIDLYDHNLKQTIGNVWNKPEVTRAINTLVNGKKSVPLKILELFKDALERGEQISKKYQAIKQAKEVKHYELPSQGKLGRHARRNARRKALQEHYQATNSI